MKTEQVIASIDPASMNDAASLGSVHGPCVSLFLSTHRFGPETTTQDPLRLRNLVKAAKSEDLVDRAVFETLAHNGEIIVTDPDALGVNTVVAAVLRY